MKGGISLEVVWIDRDMIELRVRAWNKQFSGAVEFDQGHGAAREFADAIEGFPANASDTRRFGLGNWHGAPGEDEAQLFIPGTAEPSTRGERLRRLERERGVISAGKKRRR